MDNIHNNLPPELQAQYPRASILDRKPLTQRYKERNSASKSLLTIRIRDIVLDKEGKQIITDSREIALRLKVSQGAVSARRKTLEGWGITIDKIVAPYNDFAEKVENEDDDKKLQRILDDLPDVSIIGFLKYFKDGAIRTVSKVIREAGFHPEQRDIKKHFIKTLSEAGIPVRDPSSKDKVRHYWVILSKHKDRIIEALNKDSALG